jgi:hypothetical protein
MAGAQAEGAAIPEAVAMETTTVEAEPAAPVAKATEGAAPMLGTSVAPEVGVETRVDPLPGASTDVVVRKLIIEEVAPICLVPMSETTSTKPWGSRAA